MSRQPSVLGATHFTNTETEGQRGRPLRQKRNGPDDLRQIILPSGASLRTRGVSVFSLAIPEFISGPGPCLLCRAVSLSLRPRQLPVASVSTNFSRFSGSGALNLYFRVATSPGFCALGASGGEGRCPVSPPRLRAQSRPRRGWARSGPPWGGRGLLPGDQCFAAANWVSRPPREGGLGTGDGPGSGPAKGAGGRGPGAGGPGGCLEPGGYGGPDLAGMK